MWFHMVDWIDIMNKAKIFFRKNGLLLNWKEFEKLDEIQKINTLSMISPVTNEEKQKLLEALTTKDKVESNRINHYYSRYYWDYYSFKDDLYTVTENILRINLRNSEEDKTLWTVVTVWRDGSSRSISYDEASNILVEEIMASFL